MLVTMRQESHFLLGAGAASAGNIVRSLSATSNRSRPSTAKSVAWSDEVEEQQKKEAEEEEEKKKPEGGRVRVIYSILSHSSILRVIYPIYSHLLQFERHLLNSETHLLSYFVCESSP